MAGGFTRIGFTSKLAPSDVDASELTGLKKGLKQFREIRQKLEDGTIPKDPKDRTKSQNKDVSEALNTGIFLDQVLRGRIDGWRVNDSEFRQALTDMNKGKNPTDFQFTVYKKELESFLVKTLSPIIKIGFLDFFNFFDK